MNPRTFHSLAALGLTVAAVIAAISTPPIQHASAAVPAYRPAMTVKQQVVSAALVRGYDKRQLACLRSLIYRESRWNPAAKNHASTASGLFQHLRSPSGVMLRDLTVPAQTARGLRYIDARYGDACTALRFQKARGWY